ncbi:MAG: hypothetical protein ACP5GO_00540 [Thermoprotei archaeon]
MNSLDDLERQLDRLNFATKKLNSWKSLDQRADLADLYLCLSSFMAQPTRESQQRCIQEINRLVRRFPNGNYEVGKKLVALGMIMIAAPEPMSTLIGIALVAAGKKMQNRSSIL